ncbi:hypothetical protein Sjap_001078 [Stephania japonica]|uniref:Secoisolariciresinol dehydrogenase n=1 Tax=Stephania japonica TaxID=461633 RepID=A0AAP0KJA8_9MAGN
MYSLSRRDSRKGETERNWYNAVENTFFRVTGVPTTPKVFGKVTADGHFCLSLVQIKKTIGLTRWDLRGKPLNGILGGSILEGKVAIITGGSRGMGECTARHFAKHGAQVIIADVLDDLGQAVAQDIGPSAQYVHCDISNESEMSNLVDTAIAQHGKLDIMFNNAGILDKPMKPNIVDNEKSTFEHVLSINTVGTFLATKHAARVMIPQRGGCIINTGSCVSVLGGLSSHAYVCSKFAVVGLVKNAAVELGKHGIRVNCISPHIIRTDLVKGFLDLDDEGIEKYYKHFGGKVLKSQDIADAALYLASDDAGYVSGHHLVVDGGYTIGNYDYGIF